MFTCIVLCVSCSSKLAAVLRKLHNANDMLHSSAHKTSEPTSLVADEMSAVPIQCNATDDIASNDASVSQESVEQLSDAHKECQKSVDSHEPTAHECPAAKVRYWTKC